MTDSYFYTGDIMLYTTNWAPQNFLPCDGRPLAINDFNALYAIIGMTFGGDTKNPPTYFNLPDLRGRVPIGAPSYSSKYSKPTDVGQKVGSETVCLKPENLPLHTHTYYETAMPPAMPFNVSSAPATQVTPGQSSLLAQVTNTFGVDIGLYNNDPNPTVDLNWQEDNGVVDINGESTGNGEAMTNMQPFTGIGFYICVDGLWPSAPWLEEADDGSEPQQPSGKEPNE